jgi:hypothetical protein
MNSKILLFAVLLFCSLTLSAQTPAERLVAGYENVSGFKTIEVSGVKMAFARPVLKKHKIGPMADNVSKVCVLKVERPSAKDRERFFDDMKNTLKGYKYHGKSSSPDGDTDVYVNMPSPELVDELVVYNPHKLTLNVLLGNFPVSELSKLEN